MMGVRVVVRWVRVGVMRKRRRSPTLSFSAGLPLRYLTCWSTATRSDGCRRGRRLSGDRSAEGCVSWLKV